MASYYIKDYKTATSIFRKLVIFDNQNDRYKNWLNYSKYGQRMWISKTISIISCLLIIIEIFFKKYIPNPLIGLWIDGIGLAGLSFTFGYEYFIKRSMRKSKLK